jgi:hypothetical protein
VGQGTGATASAAEVAAISHCARSECIPIAWFSHAHATFALGASGDWGWGWGATSAAADASALRYCQASGGGSGCRPLSRLVTAAPSAAGTGSSLEGRACMINAPSGAGIGPVAAGHVGWAFLVDWFTGEWMYGANEGPGNAAAGNGGSRTWSGEGHWPDLMRTFADALDGPGGANYYHAAGYYKSYRCESEPRNGAVRATNTFISMQDKTYVLGFNDCLTNAADVLLADGAMGLNTNFLVPPHDLPDWYYANDLPGFEPARSI